MKFTIMIKPSPTAFCAVFKDLFSDDIDLPWECGKGWWPLIEKVIAAIDSYNADHPEPPIQVSLIKQKFGGLRIYHYNAPEDIRQLIDEAVTIAWHTCEKCGSTTGITTNMEGYRLTLCPECRKEVKPRIITNRRINN